MAALPVVLQARIDEAEGTATALPARFAVSLGGASTAISGERGWLPLPRFAEKAYDIGFVDFVPPHVQLLETYQRRTVKSLLLCAIELAIGKRAQIAPGREIRFGQAVIRVDGQNQIPIAIKPGDSFAYVPFHSLLDGVIAPGKFTGKVVLLGYDGPNIGMVDTAVGRVSVHRLFVHLVKATYERLIAGPP
jgi:hypothetical protein